LARTGWKLRTHLAAFGLVCFLPALIGLGYIGYEMASAEQERVLRQVRDVTRDLQETVTRDLETPERILTALAASPSLDAKDWQAFQRQAEQATDGTDLLIALRTLDRQQLINTAVPFGSRPLPATSDPVLRAADERVFESKSLSFSDAYVGAAAKEYFVAADLPVLRDGNVAYLLTMAIRPDRLISRFRLGKLAQQGWLATIVGQDGRVIARSRDPQQFLGASVSGQLSSAMREAPDGTLRSTTLDGRAVQTNYTRLSNGWTVIVSVPEAILNEPVRALVLILSLVSVLATLTTLIGAWAYGSFLGRELKALSANAKRIGEQKPLIPFKQHIAEVAETQREMIEATRQIEMLVAELDHRVKNTLAVIMSVVTRSVENRREQKVVEGRIAALSRAHETLSATRWKGADLCELISAVARTYDLNVSCSGPKLLLKPKAVVSLAQVFQELLSNARDHGALRRDDGSITASWQVEDGEVLLKWIESGHADCPTEYDAGFGLKIISLCISRQLGGSHDIEAEDHGWTTNLSFPLKSELGVSAHLIED
jgi:two-component sensor histidine kinase